MDVHSVFPSLVRWGWSPQKISGEEKSNWSWQKIPCSPLISDIYGAKLVIWTVHWKTGLISLGYPMIFPTVVTSEELDCSPECHCQVYTSTSTSLSLVLGEKIKFHLTLSFSAVCRLRKISFSIILTWPLPLCCQKKWFSSLLKISHKRQYYYKLLEHTRQLAKWGAFWGGQGGQGSDSGHGILGSS